MDIIDWFTPTNSLLEIFFRGSVMYLALFLMLRLLVKREAGAVSVTDLIVIVLVADAAQGAMGDEYTSITEGLVLVGTILFWSFSLNWAGYHVPAIGRLVHPPPLELIRDGKLLLRNMRHELITEEELMSQLRQQGVERVEAVRRAYMEGDGHISVIKTDGERQPSRRRQPVA